MAAEIRLLATDLDGTVSEESAGGPVYLEFKSQLEALRAEHNTRWAIFSGRRRRTVLRLLASLRVRGICPDFLVLKYVYIYRLTSIGYLPCIRWNLMTLWRLFRGPMVARRRIDEWYEGVVRHFPRMHTLIRSRHHLRLRFESEQDAAEASDLLKKLISDFRHMRVLRARVEVEVVPVPHIKGFALSALCRNLSVDPRHVLAIGNGRNDSSMMDRSVSGFCGCPNNSDTRLMQAVHDAGGHLARQRSMAGVVEIIQAHCGNTVCSELPPGWKVPQKEMSMPEQPWGNEQNRRKVLRVAALAVVLYMVLVAFANFDLVPMSGWILKPYDWLISLLTCLPL